jgi:hypothetical protein
VREAASAAASEAAALAANALPLPGWLLSSRRELRFRCDSGGALARMQRAAAAYLGATAAGVPLGALHTVPLGEEAPLCPALIFAQKHAGRKLPRLWKGALMHRKKTIKRLHDDPDYKEFIAAFRVLVATLIAQLCGDSSGVVFQCPPTLRVQMPARTPTIALHCDSQYERHQSSEINFWIPLTPVFGSNTLHLESEPGRGDFRPMEMECGEGLRFNGQQCRHLTQANDTSATRVSFDFRVVPRSLWRDQYKGLMGDYPAEIVPGPIQLRDN